jgi:DNA-binding NarL/FixJ family response regulator
MNKTKEIQWKVTETGCWECTSHAGARGGHPQIWDGDKLQRLSHVMYKKNNGEIPIEMIIRHKCDNPKCINPEHLEIGTSKDNAQDTLKRHRFKQAKLTEENVKELLLKLKKGETKTKIARDYGVSRRTIVDIAHNRSWEYIPRP